MAQKPALGKGLASLFPGLQSASLPPQLPNVQMGAGATAAAPPIPAAPPNLDYNKDRHPGISLASVDEIQVNPYQPRREFDNETLAELAQSIRSNGIIQPLVVRKAPNGGYQLIAGERRLRASKLAGLKQVPIVIRRSTDREALELALIENIQRQDLNCIDGALAYRQLVEDFSLTQEQVAERVGKDRASVANHLRLLKLPQAIIDDLKRQILTFGHGKALAGLDDNDLRLLARAEIIEKHLSVRETEALIDSLKNGKISQPTTPQPQPSNTPLQSRLGQVAQDLTRRWATRVELKGSERRGKITIHYSSRQELDRLLETLQNQKV